MSAPRSISTSFSRDDEVMTLWENGVKAAEIAEKLGLSTTTVESIIKYMRTGAADRAHSELAIASQSAALLAAIRRYHPERCRP